MCAGKAEESWNCAKDTEKVQADQEEEGACEMAVEELAVDDSALCGDVEFSQPGIDEGEDGGQKNVGGEHGLVDVVPEGVAVLALDARVCDAGEREMREGVGEDGGPVAGDVGVAEEEIDQGRGEKDQARQSGEEVGHGVEVAEPLRGAESGGEERIVGAHDLAHAAGPADALLDVSAAAFGVEARGLRRVFVCGGPAVVR